MGARPRYLTAGSGPGLMLLHGVGMTADSWFMNVPALAKDFTVAAPDLLDNGFTEPGPYQGGPPQPQTVEHLIRLADYLKLDRFSIVGSSLGSMMAVLTYLKIPDRIDRLVLVGPGSILRGAPKPDDPPAPLPASYINGKRAIENPTWEACRNRLAAVFHDPSRIPDVVVAMQMLIYARSGALSSFERRAAGLHSFEARNQYEVRSKLDHIAVPTLVLTGREDIRCKFDEIAPLVATLSNFRLLPYEKCGHWPHMEHPEAFNRDVTAFLCGDATAGARSA